VVREVDDLRRALARKAPTRAIIGDAPVMRRLLERLPIAARTDSPILVTGETGTGKELVARSVHAASPRASGPFIAVNCGAVPPNLLASELFGHVKGAFTDARTDKQGLVGEADGGTLFLDEIAEMAPELQVKLLRFLQEGEIRPVGSARPRQVDVRVVAATHRELRRFVADGRFRQDLFYRLNVIPLTVPALRERREDVPLLAAHLLTRHTAESTRPQMRFTAAALKQLMQHDWPGNVRELENVVRRAAVFATGEEIAAVDLDIDPPLDGQAGAGIDLDVPLKAAKDAAIAAIEVEYAEAALQQSGGNIAQAARRVGVDRKSFWALMQRHDLDPDRYRR
jgi:two-component system NtrC family response regulator